MYGRARNNVSALCTQETYTVPRKLCYHPWTGGYNEQVASVTTGFSYRVVWMPCLLIGYLGHPFSVNNLLVTVLEGNS